MLSSGYSRILILTTRMIAIALLLALGPLLGNSHAWAAPRDAVRPMISGGHAGRFVAGEIIVKFKSNTTRTSIQSSLGKLGLATIDEMRGLPVFRVRVPAGKELEYASLFAGRGDVEYAEPNHIVQALWTPNDPYYASYQWNLAKIGMPAAWDYTRGNSSVKVAVIDTGIDTGHPDRPYNLVLDYDYVGGDWNPYDDNGHGTHVAGITAANTNNGIGVAGVAPGATVVVIKGLDANGSGNTYYLAQAVQRAADIGAKVINMSWGSDSDDPFLHEMVDYAFGHGALLVAAAGNSYQQGNPTMYPAAYSNVMAVAATNSNDQHASYSETGPWISVAAPGGDPNGDGSWILSTWPSSTYNSEAGTSMAAPHVSGLAALLFSLNPNLSNSQVRSIIENTAVNLGDSNSFGHGRIDAAAAVRAASPSLQANPSSLTFMLQPTDPDQQGQGVSIGSGTSAQLNWSASNLNGSSWLSFSPSSGTTPASLYISVNKAGLSQGWYQGYVQLTAPGAGNSPLNFSVRLYVGPVYRSYMPLVAKNSRN